MSEWLYEGDEQDEGLFDVCGSWCEMRGYKEEQHRHACEDIMVST